MSCDKLVHQIDEFLDGELPAQEARAIEAHVAQCDACATALDARRALLTGLAELPVDDPETDFFDRLIEQAAVTRPSAPSRWRRARQSLAAAAAVLLVAGVTWQAGVFSDPSDVPEITIALHEVTPANLRFSSAVDLEDARLSLQLPEGVALAGHAGRSALSWRTSLKAGNNVLELPLVGYVASTDRLTAELEHPQGSKSFELQITVN